MQGNGVVGRTREGHGWVNKAKEELVRNGKGGKGLAMQGRARRQ